MNLFSIIVVSYNTKKKLIKTLNSIKKQTYNNYEIVIIDGLSTDGTINFVKKNRNKKIKFFTEKDNGIYDAMNKGIKKANGQWTLFLNSGDIFVDQNILINVNAIIKKKSDIIFGNTIIKNKDLTYNHYSEFISNYSLQIPFCHQSVFTRTKLLKQNLFNLKYKICADFNLFINLQKKNFSFQQIKFPISIVISGGLSDKNRFKVFYENIKILKKNKILTNKIFLLGVCFIKIILTKFVKFILPKFIITQVLKVKYHYRLLK
ncbi:glycosyltransferase [Candidatus Pelagibacter ubique]|nr:glycosyltransferase [Candidatus Pelagibacter ubique]